MTCGDCWYCIGAFTRVRDHFYYCLNPKSEYLAQEIKKSFECPAFSDRNLPDKEAEKIIHDREWVKKINVIREKQYMTGNDLFEKNQQDVK